MGIVYRREDKQGQAAKGATVTYGSANGKPRAGIAYIDNKPYEIKEGETILAFIHRITGRTMCPHFAMHQTLIPSVAAGSAVWMWRLQRTALLNHRLLAIHR